MQAGGRQIWIDNMLSITNILPMRMILLLLLPFLNMGCTVVVWHEALTSKPSSPHVVGSTADGSRRAVVEYYDYDGIDSHYDFFALGADCDGRLAGPLVYDGFERTASGIARDLVPPQRTEVMHFRFAKADRVNPASVDHFARSDGARVCELLIPELDCVAIALDGGDRPLPLVGPADKPNCEQRLAEDARIVLLPATQPQSPRARAGAIGRAVLLTPLTLVVDVVIVPVGLILVATGNIPRC